MPPFLRNLAQRIQDSRLNAELLVVDDGSRGDHHQVYQELTRSIQAVPIQLLEHPVNLGKGAAIRTGFRHARGAWVGFADADGSTAADEVVRVAQLALHSPDLDGIFGARIVMLGREVVRKHRRHVTGRVFTTLLSLILRIPVYDSQCGCKFFRRATIAPLLELCKEQRWLFDVEIIALGYFKHLKFLEVPISWQDVPGSKVHLLSDGIRMAIGLWRIRRRQHSLRISIRIRLWTTAWSIAWLKKDSSRRPSGRASNPSRIRNRKRPISSGGRSPLPVGEGWGL